MSYFEELHPEMDRYLEDTASKEPEILKRLRKETYKNHATTYDFWLFAGQVTFFNFKIISQKHIRNRHFTGLRCLCLAEGLQKKGN